MQTAPRTLRLHIGIFGRRNVGKSSLLNAIARQSVSIVSDAPGTTADPVEKPMELPPLGPVLFIDTAGVDDEGHLGELRRGRSEKALDRIDLGLVVAEPDSWTPFEDELLREIRARGVPALAVINKADLRAPSAAFAAGLEAKGCPAVACSAATGAGLADLREAMLRLLPDDCLDRGRLASDLVPPGGTALLVVPIDRSAPKGRIILPQVMAIRDLLDGGAFSLVCRPEGLAAALGALRTPPAIVITDSQAFRAVALAVPGDVPMTSFSILMARLQGDLAALAEGARAIPGLRAGDRVLIQESCSHHATDDDIGRVKLPAWLSEAAGAPLDFEHSSGRDFPDDVSGYALVVHCGNCMGARREMLSRINRCLSKGVPITNYGVAIAQCLGIMGRALAPFGLEGGGT
jgi:[FeFe] hydrogenase H-cluster maturation GTPase HydF